MNSKKFLFKAFSCLLIVCLLSTCLLGCVNLIREDAVKDNLPPVKPAAGAAREVEFSLHFKLRNDPLLVALASTVNVRANEYPAAAVLRQLIEGPAAVYQDLSSVLPSTTQVLDIKQERNILFVTLNAVVLDPANYPGGDKQAQRLGVYAIVNSLCSLESVSSVQIMVDTSNTGQGSRVSPFQLGFESGQIETEFLGALTATESVIATPARIVECVFSHIVNEDYAKAYALFADHTGGTQKPADYAAFETEMLSIGQIESFQVINASIPNAQTGGEAVVDFVWVA
ncbi:GerMN domain-containing protein, partial [Eubacteriales bacterium OttesenSCG-928-K08]|nr:GerMN domain-containing protein [Eubacteriales bacterium OttesenSCG-928-K08]